MIRMSEMNVRDIRFTSALDCGEKTERTVLNAGIDDNEEDLFHA